MNDALGSDTPQVDRNGLEIPSRDECFRLLSSRPVGRLAFWWAGAPMVIPVNFVVGNNEVVIRTAPGTKLDAAHRSQTMALEVDDIDPMYHSGWSVVVRGRGRSIEDAVELAQARRLPLGHWASGPAEDFVSVAIESISGRRIRPLPPSAH